jgi:glycosyltransferase involved in cell wall biosynthesis
MTAPSNDAGARLIGRLPPIIAFADNPWHGAWMNRQQVLSRLARRGWPVLYSTGAVSLWDRGRRKWADAPWLNHFEETDGIILDVAGRWPSRWPTLSSWDRLVMRRHASRLDARISSMGGGSFAERGIAILYHPQLLPYVEQLKPRRVIFYAYDALSMTPGWTAADEALLRRTLDRADLVVASSPMIARQLSEAATEIRVLPNGADVDAFAAGARSACPADLAAVPHPRIGYVGNISQKVDLQSVAEVARKRPDWHWVMVGDAIGLRADTATSATYDACRRLTNVHFLGRKHHGELPAYVNHMDVNTMCYRQQGGWWVSGYPLKLHEYLAAGKPVVSADIEAVREFDSVVDIARTTDQWIDAIEKALSQGGEGSPDSRQKVARRNSWDSRVDQLHDWLLEISAARTGAT